MLRKYKNQIFEKIKELGYDVNLFEFTKDQIKPTTCNDEGFTNRTVDILSIKNKDYLLVFYENPKNESLFKYSFSTLKYKKTFIKEEGIRLIPHASDFTQFNSILGEVLPQWLKDNQDYFDSLEEPDLWELAKNKEKIFSSNMNSFEPNDDYLSPQEQKQFYIVVNDFERKLIEQYQPSQEKIEEIHKVVQEIKSESLKQSKRTLWQKFNERWFPNIATTLGFEVVKTQAVQNIFFQSIQTVSNIVSDMIKISIEVPLIF